jgi:Pre-mRNA splicing factor PRP21 like protein
MDEEERELMATIDWNDFVVVATIDFVETEATLFNQP